VVGRGGGVRLGGREIKCMRRQAGNYVFEDVAFPLFGTPAPFWAISSLGELA